MATLEIPVRSDLPAYKFEIDLEGDVFIFFVRYNRRMDSWFLTIRAPQNAEIINSIRLCCGIDLLRGLAAEGKPKGALVVLDTTGANLDPTKSDLGTRHFLMYVESTGG